MISNGQKILDQIKKLQSEFEINSETPEEILEEKLSFLDRINKLIRLILNDDSLSVYDALNKDNLEKWKKSRSSKLYKVKSFILKYHKNFLYFLFLSTITGFLVSEALSFYTIGSAITAKTYVKAILTEICFIFLSGYRTVNKIELVFVGILRVCIFFLMMFVISSQVFIQGTTEIGNSDSISKQITLIEGQIEEKEKSIIYYRDVKKWALTTKQLIKEKDDLVKKLIELREKQGSGSSVEVSKLVEYRMYGRAIFRILLLFISVLITRRMFKF